MTSRDLTECRNDESWKFSVVNFDLNIQNVPGWPNLRYFDDFATKCLFWKLSNPFVEMIKTAAFSTFSKFWTQN